MSEHDPQFDYPVQIDPDHTAAEPVGYDGDKFTCEVGKPAYTHTGAWPTWDFCPYCGRELPLVSTA